MIALLWNTVSLLGMPALAAGCDPRPLDQALDGVDDAFRHNDADGMGSAVKQVRRALRCIEQPVPPGTCARVHRARAMAAWIDGDEAQAVSWLRAMLHADPRTDFAADVVDPRHRLRVLLTLAEEHPVRWTEGPGRHWLLVDGVRTGAVPVDQPYVLQPIRDDGQTQRARLMERGKVETSPRRPGPGEEAVAGAP